MARYVVGTLREVAEFFGLALSTLKTEWVPAGMPGQAGRGARKGKYDLGRIVAWDRKRAARRQGGADAVGTKFRAARADEQVSKAEERRIRLALLQEGVVPRAEHEQALVELGQIFVGELQAGLPGLADRRLRKAYRTACDNVRWGVAAKLRERGVGNGELEPEKARGHGGTKGRRGEKATRQPGNQATRGGGKKGRQVKRG